MVREIGKSLIGELRPGISSKRCVDTKKMFLLFLFRRHGDCKKRLCNAVNSMASTEAVLVENAVSKLYYLQFISIGMRVHS